MHMLYAVDLCRTLSVCCESFCMLSHTAVRGLGLFDFFSLLWSCSCRWKRMWACSALLFLHSLFGAPMLSTLDHVGVSE